MWVFAFWESHFFVSGISMNVKNAQDKFSLHSESRPHRISVWLQHKSTGGMWLYFKLHLRASESNPLATRLARRQVQGKKQPHTHICTHTYVNTHSHPPPNHRPLVWHAYFMDNLSLQSKRWTWGGTLVKSHASSANIFLLSGQRLSEIWDCFNQRLCAVICIRFHGGGGGADLTRHGADWSRAERGSKIRWTHFTCPSLVLVKVPHSGAAKPSTHSLKLTVLHLAFFPLLLYVGPVAFQKPFVSDSELLEGSIMLPV